MGWIDTHDDRRSSSYAHSTQSCRKQRCRLFWETRRVQGVLLEHTLLPPTFRVTQSDRTLHDLELDQFWPWVVLKSCRVQDEVR